MADNAQIITDFIAAWSRLDADELIEYFTDDGTYYNMPAQPVTGKDNVKKLIESFLTTWTETQWDIIHLVSSGDVVIAERLDRTKLGDKSVDLPCCGVFEMEGGKIKVWRDYFNMETYVSALT